jgi:hypothetical protein
MGVADRSLEWRYTARPEDVFINRLHVNYAFAVVTEQFTRDRAEPDFVDVQCPEGCVYKVFVAWEKPKKATRADYIPWPDGMRIRRPPMIETFMGAPKKREFRGLTWGLATTLASAIRTAARRTPEHYGKVTAHELAKLTCTVGLMHSVQPIVNKNDLQIEVPQGILLELHCTGHTSDLQPSVKKFPYVCLKDVVLTFIEGSPNYEQVLKHMLEDDVIVDDPDAFKSALALSKISTFCISKATVSHVHFQDLCRAREGMPGFIEERLESVEEEDPTSGDGTADLFDSKNNVY